ncbi:50S ribosomal protein L30 [Alicyclobacillus tolerans]|uniref:50S ribosomal protein L30 n=1 Tax=Alicyclobacillus tolerans TaxID=90970 RepID=UPI001F025F4D|nr:50S ribosomal protein L30 [Alicyclobacillus tolerans]MCF8565991.1 50S ribosomal protein L30 [Alicyclobacillus tolerans]
MANKLAITLVHSTIGRPENQRNTAFALGLRKLQQTVVREDTPIIRGMVARIQHLVKVENVEGE